MSNKAGKGADMSHTPTPWNIVVKDKIFIYGGNNKLVAHVCEPADAMYLADAVLNHDRLTAEVKRLREALQRCVDVMPDFLSCDHPAKTHALSVLNPEEPK